APLPSLRRAHRRLKHPLKWLLLQKPLRRSFPQSRLHPHRSRRLLRHRRPTPLPPQRQRLLHRQVAVPMSCSSWHFAKRPARRMPGLRCRRSILPSLAGRLSISNGPTLATKVSSIVSALRATKPRRQRNPLAPASNPPDRTVSSRHAEALTSSWPDLIGP